MGIDFRHPVAVQVRKKMVKAISDFHLIEPNDHIMVCVSGGKDSSIMLALLTEIQRRAPYPYTLEAVILDQKQPGFNADRFAQWVQQDLGVRLHVIERDTYSVVQAKTPPGSTYCVLCSRMRRAILYDFAVEHGFTKLALGHHRDDFNVTLLLNLFYTGKLASMPPKLRSDDGRNIVIRPLVYVAEKDLITLRDAWNIPVIPCNLCGSQENLKRRRMKQLLEDLEEEIPFIQESMLTAQGNIKASHLLPPLSKFQVDDVFIQSDR
ncbi:MAG: tRNA 2-thiocytidine(32) synthetase TtcA [Bdellovibrionaceae bacterium]|nr:tRNA 2-thiocytidine(32) synthetase TtcA [Pseudobdellovibrionaceae bacterium]MDW8190289.1 tRNA 2-thiocytidine(32) synthetase TtcA [Pseudobdellovibrionaceae bacterium]